MKQLALLLGLVILGCRPASNEQASVSVPSGAEANQALSVQERRLLVAATIALPPAGLAPDSLPDPTQPGARMLAQYCVQCHALPSPAMHGAVDWPSVARRMWARIDKMRGDLGIATPSMAERSQLLNYLTSHALRVPENLPAGAGRAQFEETCSRCHVLPDPRIHSAPDWPVVVMRMERNMERMKVSGVTPEVAQRILGYLQMASAAPR